MATIEVKVPDIGDFDGIPVIELLVAVGDTVRKDQGLITLESDKATMEVPSSADGVVKELKVKVGDKVAEGAVIAILESAALESAAAAEAPAKPAAPAAAPAATHAEAAKPPVSPSPAAPAVAETKPALGTGRKPDIECRIVVIGAG